MMRNERKTKPIPKGLPLKTVLIWAVALLVAIAVIVVAIRVFGKKDTATVDEGRAALHELAQQDVVAIEDKINTARAARDGVAMAEKEEEALSDEELMASLGQRFSSTVVVGDSFAEALGAYQIINDSSIIGQKGERVGDCEERLKQAIALAPANIVFCYGNNDIGMGTTEEFEENYHRAVQTIKAALPSTKIAICAIAPVQDWVIESEPVYGEIPAMNEAIRRVCESEGCLFIEVADMITEYSEDGQHPTYEYYKRWAVRMKEMLEL